MNRRLETESVLADLRSTEHDEHFAAMRLDAASSGESICQHVDRL
jgi:hypothetical protein